MVSLKENEKILKDIGSFDKRQLVDMANAVYFSLPDDRKENTADTFRIEVTGIDYSNGFVYYVRKHRYSNLVVGKGALFFKDFYFYLNDSRRNRFGDLLGSD
jgi:hypothetical protein